MDVALSAAERRRLRASMRKAVTARLYRRLQAVLLVGEGRPTKEVAAITGANRLSVQHWCRVWRRSAACRRPEQVLAEKPHRGRPPSMKGLSRRRLLAEASQRPVSVGVRGYPLDGAAASPSSETVGPIHYGAYVAPAPARGRLALEGPPLRVCEAGAEPAPKKGHFAV
jgi:hypothetical protein